MLKKLTGIFVLSFLFLSTAAAEPPSDANLDDLFTVTHSEQLLNDTLASMDQNMNSTLQQMLSAQAASSPERNAEAMKILQPVLSRFSDRAKQELSWAKMKPRYVDLYKQTFTKEEVEGMVAFYKTPAGQAAITKLPALMQRLMVMSQQVIVPMLHELQGDLQKTIAASFAGKTPA